MPRLVHLARASLERTFSRAGIRGARWEISAADGQPERLDRAVFAMPVLRDFSITHQWLRELRRFHGERMIAVHFTVPRTEVVWAGRYGQPHALLPAGEAVARVMADPAGAEIVVPRAIGRRAIVGIREVTQLVGWTEVPPDVRNIDCVCVACLPKGSRTLMRRVHAAYERCLTEARRHTDAHGITQALLGLDVPLERAGGRIAPTKLLGFTRSRHAEVRAAAAQHLSMFRSHDVLPTLRALVSDPDDDVGAAAACALERLVGPERAVRVVSGASIDVQKAFIEALAYPTDPRAAVSALEQLHSTELASAVRRTAEAIAKDDALDPPLIARLANLRGSAA